eukprot:6177599-Pleurochrysis_carterae.AAC.1
MLAWVLGQARVDHTRRARMSCLAWVRYMSMDWALYQLWFVNSRHSGERCGGGEEDVLAATSALFVLGEGVEVQSRGRDTT